MGRSVMVPRNAAVTYHFPYEDGYDEDGNYLEDLAEIYWDFMVDNIRGGLSTMDDPFISEDRWGPGFDHDEEHAIASNGIVDVVLCEYMSFCSLSLVPCEEPSDSAWEPVKRNWEEFAAEWALKHEDEIAEKLRGIGINLYRKLGTFSNGESVYRAV